MEKAEKLNILDFQKLSKILIRFFFTFSSSHEYLFTDEEKDKLINTLNISSVKLDELLDIIRNILFQAIQNTIQPGALRDLLVSKGLHENLADVFSEQWAENGKMVVSRTKKMSLAEWQMGGLTWECHAEASSTNTARQKHPIAVLNFSLFEPDLPLHTETTKPEPQINAKEFVVQMDKEKLLEFYNELEKIQHQIESLKQ